MKQYNGLMKGETGYEHYFINYYLYLPFSKNQEEFCLTKSIDLMQKLNLIEHSKKEEFLSVLKSFYNNLKIYNDMPCDEIKHKLKSERKNLRTEQPFSNFDPLSLIIYGDFKYKNENVEVYLHQRTMKKVLYKKREYSLIHPLVDIRK
jgi:hypothetical protein